MIQKNGNGFEFQKTALIVQIIELKAKNFELLEEISENFYWLFMYMNIIFHH